MNKDVKIIGVPMDFGQLRRGLDMGPAAARYTGLVSALRTLGHHVEDLGDVRVPVRTPVEEGEASDYIEQIRGVCEQVYDQGRTATRENAFPLFIGGDHSIAIGTVGGVSHDRPTGLIWIDAHADFNTPVTSPSGNIHGMPLAVLTGDGDDRLVNLGRPGAKVDLENIVMIGIRDVDRLERERLKKSGITVYTMSDIDEQGMSTIAKKALMKLIHLKRVHLSLDIDALDPVEAPGVGTPVPGGLTFREAHLFMEILSDSGKLTSMDLVEINPILDQANKTAKLAVDLIVSALGKSIL
ncbi:arginase [Desulforapulum autotrophicum]|nr:arginase [Desulforapulum autotrophicum]